MIHKKILLVDDDVDDQLIFTDALNELKAGVECFIANNALKGLQYLKESNPTPSLVFLDLNMPLMNGFEFLEHIKKEKKLIKIPVVIFTTSSSPADKRLTTELGAKSFFTKTHDFNFLKTKLWEFLHTDFDNN